MSEEDYYRGGSDSCPASTYTVSLSNVNLEIPLLKVDEFLKTVTFFFPFLSVSSYATTTRSTVLSDSSLYNTRSPT